MKPAPITDWLRLVRSKITYPAKLQLVRESDGLAEFGTNPVRSEASAAKSLSQLRDARLQAAIEGDLEWLNQPHHHFITPLDSLYPRQLFHIHSPPLGLFVRGDPAFLARHQLAVVGSRRATPSALELTRRISKEVSSFGLVITSGLAVGIDAAAHQGALDAKRPTVAVMGTGCDRIYPQGNRRLADEIAANGALVSEFPLGVAPLAANFPRRNRIISGLTLGVLVVEAAEKSGSLITARLAGEQGKEVMAIPGAVQNPLSRGCHRLIRQGAALVESAADILMELGVDIKESGASAPGTGIMCPRSMSKTARLILDQIDYTAVDLDQLLERTGLDSAALCAGLTELELAEMVCNSAGFYSRMQ